MGLLCRVLERLPALNHSTAPSVAQFCRDPDDVHGFVIVATSNLLQASLETNVEDCYLPFCFLFVLRKIIDTLFRCEFFLDFVTLWFVCGKYCPIIDSGGATARPPRAAGRACRRFLKENFLCIKEERCSLLAKYVLYNEDCPGS